MADWIVHGTSGKVTAFNDFKFIIYFGALGQTCDSLRNDHKYGSISMEDCI